MAELAAAFIIVLKTIVVGLLVSVPVAVLLFYSNLPFIFQLIGYAIIGLVESTLLVYFILEEIEETM